MAMIKSYDNIQNEYICIRFSIVDAQFFSLQFKSMRKQQKYHIFTKRKFIYPFPSLPLKERVIFLLYFL